MQIVEHHIKYKEIHGVDETVFITRSEHQKIHRRLRREGKCKIPSKQLNVIANAAHNRTEKQKEYLKQYHQTDKMKQWQSNYCKKAYQHIEFVESLSPSIMLREQITYNILTGVVSYTSQFKAYNGLSLYHQDCREKT